MLHRKKWLLLFTLLAYLPIEYSLPTHPRIDLFLSFLLAWIAIEAVLDRRYDPRMLFAFGGLVILLRQDMVAFLTILVVTAFFQLVSYLFAGPVPKRKQDGEEKNPQNQYGSYLASVIFAMLIGLSIIMIWNPYGWIYLNTMSQPDSWTIYPMAVHVVADAFYNFFSASPFYLLAIGLVFAVPAYLRYRHCRSLEAAGCSVSYPWQTGESVMYGLLAGFLGAEFFFGLGFLVFLAVRLLLALLSFLMTFFGKGGDS